VLPNRVSGEIGAVVMPSEFYELGYEAGRNSANGHRDAITKTVDSSDLGHLAGEAMDSHRKAKGEWYSDKSQWRIGFWSGFMDRAEQIRT